MLNKGIAVRPILEKALLIDISKINTVMYYGTKFPDGLIYISNSQFTVAFDSSNNEDTIRAFVAIACSAIDIYIH